MRGRAEPSGGWRRDLQLASVVLPPMAVLGFPVLLAETWHPAGLWAEVGLVLLRLVLLAASYLLLLMPLRRSRGWGAPRLHLQTAVAIAGCSVLIPVLDQVVMQLLGFWRVVPAGRWLLLFAHGQVQLYVLMPAVLVCGCALVEHSLAAAAEAQRLELRSQRMLARYRESRLKLLRLQLHPHFLFNALNSVAALLVSDRAAAAEMMGRLQSLYGRSLRSLERHLVPVSEELDWCREYLEVERRRFSDRLRVEIRLEPDAASAAVPPLLLQPLVENAVRHGVAREPGAAWIEIAARVAEDGSLRIRVANGVRAGGVGGEGFGLRHTRRRLEETYGDHAALEVVKRGSRVEAMLRLPPPRACRGAGCLSAQGGEGAPLCPSRRRGAHDGARSDRRAAGRRRGARRGGRHLRLRPPRLPRPRGRSRQRHRDGPRDGG